MMTQKYIRLKENDEIVIFPYILQHSKFKDLEPISAGFCYIEKEKITCFGSSKSLKLESNKDDSGLATKQIFGIKAYFKM